jgi:hypothetical protein
MQKLTKEEALELYNSAWRGDMSNAEIAEKYHVRKELVSSIKHGFTWRAVTLHIRGKVPKMSIEQKKAVLLKGQEADIAIDDRFLALLEERGQDIAYQFKQATYDKRGLLRRKLTIAEVEGLYDQFRKRK